MPPVSQAGKRGSTPLRANDQVVESADTRRSERRAFGRGSSTLPLVTAGGQGPAGPHEASPLGSSPRPATQGYGRAATAVVSRSTFQRHLSCTTSPLGLCIHILMGTVM